MARVPRYVLPGQPQHIIQRGNDRQMISASDMDFQCFRDAMVSASDQRVLAIHAHAWMSNHIHLPATPHSIGSGLAIKQPGNRYPIHVRVEACLGTALVHSVSRALIVVN